VGIAGGPVKTKLCTEVFGYDAAIDDKAGDLDQALSAACPDGVDAHFDNTAGTISGSVLRHPAVGARIVICGTASVASWTPRLRALARSVICRSSVHRCRACWCWTMKRGTHTTSRSKI